MISTNQYQKTTALGYLFGIGVCTAKVAILLLLLRIFKPMLGFRTLVYIGIALVSIVNLFAVPLYAALCRPLKGQRWDFAMLESRCAHPTSLHTVIIGVLGTVLDIYVWVIPLPLVFGLHLPLKKKIGVAIVFMAGIL